jgi:putative sigma-54 modulation protein
MNINLQGNKVELTDKIKDYAQKKMDMLEKYLGDVQVINCDVELAQDVTDQQSGYIYRAEVNLELPGELLRVEKVEQDMFKAIDKVKDHMHRSIKRYKEKRMKSKRRAQAD